MTPSPSARINQLKMRRYITDRWFLRALKQVSSRTRPRIGRVVAIRSALPLDGQRR